MTRIIVCAGALGGSVARGEKLPVTPEVAAAAGKIYAGDIDGARADAVRIEEERPEHPVGFLLEAESLWWRIWCTAAEFKYGMTYPRRRMKNAADRRYLELAAKITALAEAQIAQHDSAEMEFYAGMGEAFASRLYGLRGENRNTARSGVRGRERFLRAMALDPELADADLGLGLYNYYIDTLSGAARVLRFFMGIPGGSKKDGIRQLRRAIDEGKLASEEARFYLAISLHNYDQQYEQALEVIGPLAEKYPLNALFQLARGDLYAKLGRREQAVECYRRAGAAAFGNEECGAHIRELARAALAAVGVEGVAAGK